MNSNNQLKKGVINSAAAHQDFYRSNKECNVNLIFEVAFHLC